MTTVKTNKFQPVALIISLAITLAIGFVASLFTRPEIPVWYAQLKKPSFTPPDWAFPVAWTTLYVLIAIAAYQVWKQRNNSPAYNRARIIYFIQLFLNFCWSIVFFGMHQIFSALVIIVLLWLYIALNMVSFKRFSTAAAWLLLPYLLWVSFATALNFSIYVLNK